MASTASMVSNAANERLKQNRSVNEARFKEEINNILGNKAPSLVQNSLFSLLKEKDRQLGDLQMHNGMLKNELELARKTITHNEEIIKVMHRKLE